MFYSATLRTIRSHLPSKYYVFLAASALCFGFASPVLSKDFAETRPWHTTGTSSLAYGPKVHSDISSDTTRSEITLVEASPPQAEVAKPACAMLIEALPTTAQY